MLILGIETSCDDTCIAILKFKNNKNSNLKIVANVIYSQNEIHQAYGGIFPNIAIREHKKKITQTLLQTLKDANLLEKKEKKELNVKKQSQLNKIQKILKNKNDNILISEFQKIIQYKKPKIDYLSVTIGPGLEPCLWVGINFAKALSLYWDIPIIPVNHIEGHIIVNFIRENTKSEIQNTKQIRNPKTQKSKLFPAACLVVSGGHTQLILMEKIGKYKIIGETRDDAAGECFDKVAKILGLNYPGGPAVAEQALQWETQTLNNKNQINSYKQTRVSKFNINLPKPMKYQKNFDFSFSGLKTAVFYDFKSRSKVIQKNKRYIQEMCYKVEEAIVDVLLYKIFKAIKQYSAKTIFLGGGVTANSRLREELKKEAKNRKIDYFIPEKNFSIDNAAMIAMVAFFYQNQAVKGVKKEFESIKANSSLRISYNRDRFN